VWAVDDNDALVPVGKACWWDEGDSPRLKGIAER
jgi:hypothetical protein